MSLSISSSPAPGERRPHRPQSQPACLSCRARKSRCSIDPANPLACLMCKAHGTRCVFPDSTQSPSRPSRASRKPLARRRGQKTPVATTATTGEPRVDMAAAVVAAAEGDVGETPFSSSAAVLSGGGDDSHVVGPVQNPEAQLIANYLQNGPGLHARAGAMHVAPGGQPMAGKKPILFNAIRRHPLGYAGSQSIASQKCDVVEHLVGPFRRRLIDVYFDKVHVCFPLLDATSFLSQYAADKGSISPALLASLYAHSLTYWRTELQQRPDLRYVWNQASEALYSELHLSPGISTVIAILLNVSGRPLSAMVGNAVLLGSAISLAHSLGLNRDCLDWNLSPSEKSLRVRLWWAIVTYDKWSSVTYGTPPQIRTAQHDVPLPSPDDMFGQGAPGCNNSESAAVFMGLITLTGILDRYLDHVFNLRWSKTDTYDDASVSLDMEAKLTEWVDSLPRDLRRRIIRGIDLSVPGLANLRLAYLYVMLLARKLGIDSEEHEDQATDHPGLSAQRRILARQSAESIVLFVQELDDDALGGFWLSFNAFALSTTVAFLLRSALETEHQPSGLAQSIFLRLAADMMAALKSHRERMGWDLANICIAQYAEVVDKLMMMPPNDQAAESMPALQQFLMTEAVGVDDMFPSIWDVFNTGE